MPRFSCSTSLKALAALAMMTLPVQAEDFTRDGHYVDWVLACPQNNMTAANPVFASNGRCLRLTEALETGAPPANLWESKSPAVGTVVLNMIDPIHVFLADLGFREPALFNPLGAAQTPSYRLTLAPKAILKGKKPGEDAYGMYSGEQLYIGVDSHVNSDGTIKTDELMNTLAHEYFHAIQDAYTDGHDHDDEDNADDSDAESQPAATTTDEWLFEGTAEYVGRYYENRTNTKPYDWKTAYRDFALPLTNADGGGYENHIFFALLARIMNGRGTNDPGMAGFGISKISPGYLEKIFSGYQETPAGMDPATGTLKWFAAAVPVADPAGRSLQELYGLVMRDLTYQPDFGPGKFPFMPGQKFDPDEISLIGQLGPGWTQLTQTYTIEPVATHFYEIDPTTFPEPGALAVRVVIPESDTTDPTNLQLSMHGVSYSTPERPETHNFGVIEKGDDKVYLSVSNIDEVEHETKQAKYQIELSWLSGGLCNYDVIYSSTRIDEQKNAARDIGVPLEVYDAFYPPPSAFQEKYGARGRNNELEGDPTILPDKARLVIRGGMFTLGGDACSHHLAANGLVEAGILGESMGFSAETEAQTIINELPYVSGAAKQISDLDRTRRELNKTLDLLGQITGGSLFGTDPRDASVVFSVFSPDLFGFYHGMPAIVETGPFIAGRGGWDPNSSGAVNIILPGIKLAGRLSGVVTITKVTAAHVRGEFTLRGRGSTRVFTAELQDIDGEDQRIEKDFFTEDTSVSVSGSFSAPTTETGIPIFAHIFGLRSVSRREEMK